MEEQSRQSSPNNRCAALEAAREIWDSPYASTEQGCRNDMAEIISRHYAPLIEAAEQALEMRSPDGYHSLRAALEKVRGQ